MSTDRNIDLPDLIVNLQRSSEPATPTAAGLSLYLYKSTSDEATLSGSVTATPSGLYYVWGPPGGGQDVIKWSEFTWK